MSTFKQISDFLDSFSISNTELDIQTTKQINRYLNDYWQGTSSKIDWDKINSKSIKIYFSELITKSVINHTTKNYKFKCLDSEKLVLYYSGFEPCFLIDHNMYNNFLYEFMDRFCFLDGFILLSYDDMIKDEALNFIEVRIFDYICGQI